MKKDLTGARFGRLTVIEPAPMHGKKTVWKCRCDCGKTIEVMTSNLSSGHTKSCGCYKNDIISTHGMRTRSWSHPLYGVWDNMRQRCGNPNATGYHRYGGRGIRVCPEWESNFEAFYTWAISNGYQQGLQIDRIDNDGNYTPDNCRWVTKMENGNNRKGNHFIEFNGESHTIAEWSRITGISEKAIHYRVKAGKPVDQILHRGGITNNAE